MTALWVCSNQKGGSGKTTTTLCLADGLARQGKRVLIIDADPQATAYKWESRPGGSYPRYPVRVEKISGLSPQQFMEAVLAKCDAELQLTGQELDYVLIDTPPNLQSNDLAAALYVADLVVVPVKPNALHIDALEELYALFDHVNSVRKGEKRDGLDIRVLVNFLHANRRSNQQLVTVLQNSAKNWSTRRNVQSTVLEASFKYLAGFENAPNFRTSLFNLPGTKDARDAVNDVIKELTQ